MNCTYAPKKSCNPQCVYCVYPDGDMLISREKQVQKLQGLRTVLIKKLLCVEKQLLNPRKKGGDIYANI